MLTVCASRSAGLFGGEHAYPEVAAVERMYSVPAGHLRRRLFIEVVDGMAGGHDVEDAQPDSPQAHLGVDRDGRTTNHPWATATSHRMVRLGVVIAPPTSTGRPTAAHSNASRRIVRRMSLRRTGPT